MAKPSEIGAPESDIVEHHVAAKAKRILFVDAAGNVIASIPISHSAVISQNIVDFHSDDAAQRLTAGGEKILSPDGTRSTYYDLDGKEGMYFSFCDNSPGATGGTMYFRWSRDAANTPYNDPGDGTGGSNFDAVSTATPGAVFIPKKQRYVNMVFVQGIQDQGDTYPQMAMMNLAAYPNFFTSDIKVVNPSNQPVWIGTGVDGNGYSTSQVVMGAIDGALLFPSAVTGILVGTNWAAHIAGHQTSWTGAALVVADKLATTASLATVSLAAATSTQLAASAIARRGVHIWNNHATEVLYLKFATAASNTSFIVQVAPGKDFDWSRDASGNYSGVIHGYCVNANNAVIVTTW